MSRYSGQNLILLRVGYMNIEEQKLVLNKRCKNLHKEIAGIQDEVVVLLAMIKKAEEELEEIQTKLSKLEESNNIKFALAS
jgi:lipid II:glycine glycyltransferase (peptidoglycan interpeptide bridge formation enzyme)